MLDNITGFFKELFLKQREPHILHAEDTGRRTQTVYVPDGYKAHPVELGELANVQYVHQHTNTRRVDDFLSYLGKYGNSDSFVTIAPEVSFKTPIAKAIIDFHAPNSLGGEWQRHTIDYSPQAYPAYALLCEMDGRIFSQDDFIDKMRLLRRFLTSMPPADFIALLREFKITTEGEFESDEDPVSGSVNFRYKLRVQGSSGNREKVVEVPEKFTFQLPVLFDGGPLSIDAEFFYRKPADDGPRKVQMGIRIVDRVYIEQDALDLLSAKIRAESGLLTVVGATTNYYPVK